MTDFLAQLVINLFAGADPFELSILLGLSLIAVNLLVIVIMRRIYEQTKRAQERAIEKDDNVVSNAFYNMHGLDETTMIPNNPDKDYDYSKRQL